MSFKTLLVAAMAMAIPASALAGAVTVQNKDGKKVVLVVKRSNSSTKPSLAAVCRSTSAPRSRRNRATALCPCMAARPSGDCPGI